MFDSSANTYCAAFGTKPIRAPVYSTQTPSSTNTNYPIGQLWINTATNNCYILTSITSQNSQMSANWQLLGGTNGYPVTPFVVGLPGNAGYQTIQSALNSANSQGGGIILVQPGTYNENLTLYSHCHITGLTFADAGGGVIINGIHTPPTSGGFVFNNVQLESSTHIFNSNAAGSAHLIIANAAIIVTNGYTYNLPNWTGKLETYDVNDRGSTNDGFINNTGGSEIAVFSAAVGAGSLNSMTLSGAVSIFTCAIGCPMNFITGSDAFLEYNVHLAPITLSNNSTGEIIGSEIDSYITMSSSASWLISNCVINTSNNPAIAGSGSGVITLGDNTFISNSSISNSLTTSGATTISGSLTAFEGNITATNGNLLLNTPGNKLNISVGTNASLGTSTTMSGTPGTVTINTTACTTSSIIIYSRATAGGTLGNVSISNQLSGSFVLTSTANETSTFNYLIIN